MKDLQLIRAAGYWQGIFRAMAGPCEVLMEVEDEAQARHYLEQAATEAWRIEAKYSRYRDDNIVYQINHAQGLPVVVDEETAGLLDFADHCYRLSEGRFDVTSGVLRELWIFDGGDQIPRPDQVARILPRMGWDKVRWQQPELKVPLGMEVDFGGIGKEYAVDQVIRLLREQGDDSILVNFGGDLAVTTSRKDGAAWQVGLEDPSHPGRTHLQLSLREGALATSGDSRRFILKNGERYGHILDPRTGAPVMGAPRSITVVAPNCSEAGILAIIAMLHGEAATQFLDEQQVRYWVLT